MRGLKSRRRPISPALDRAGFPAEDVSGVTPRSGTRLRVLVVTNQWPSAEHPARVLVARQVEGLRRRGLEIDVVVVDGYKSRANYLRALVKLFALNFEPRRYDLIHAHTGHCGVVASVQLRYPVVLSYVGYDLNVSDREGALAKVERLVFRQLSHLVASTVAKSPGVRQKLPRAALSRNTVIPGGVDREQFVPMPQEDTRRRLGWSPDAPVVLFAAEPNRYTKRFELARSAFDVAHAKVPELQLVVGADVAPADMPLWMNAADVLLLTSRGEGSPNVVKEAMACNLPVVSVDVGDVREVVQGTEHCRICEPDAVELGAALLEVVSALPARSNGRERSTHLSLEAVADRLVVVYEQARTRGPGLFGFWPRRIRNTRRQPPSSP